MADNDTTTQEYSEPLLGRCPNCDSQDVWYKPGQGFITHCVCETCGTRFTEEGV
jgi:uncharacterized protein (DUF983 family)